MYKLSSCAHFVGCKTKQYRVTHITETQPVSTI